MVLYWVDIAAGVLGGWEDCVWWRGRRMWRWVLNVIGPWRMLLCFYLNES
jgi:hypothetical protein